MITYDDDDDGLDERRLPSSSRRQTAECRVRDCDIGTTNDERMMDEFLTPTVFL